MRLRVGTFGGVSALPLLIARDSGAFERRGLEVTLEMTPDSGRLRDRLRGGDLEIVHLAPDNVIAWVDDGESAIRAWLGGSAGPISLLARGVTEVGELRGRRIGVDSPGSGFAPILRQLLRRGGVDPSDVELVSLGATRLRFAALQEASVDATMLTLPWSARSASAGASVLGDHTVVAPGLLTSCAAALEPWLVGHAAAAGDYADAVEAALLWMHEPHNLGATTKSLAEEMQLDHDLAGEVLSIMLDPERGWPRSVRLQGPELRPTWSLRAEAVSEPMSAPSDYVCTLPSR